MIEIEVMNYRELNRSSLRASFTLIIAGMKINDCTYFVSGDRKWFNFPTKEVKYNDGRKTDYFPVIKILDRGYKDLVEEEVIKKLSFYEKKAKGVEHGEQVQANQRPQNPLPRDASELPF